MNYALKMPTLFNFSDQFRNIAVGKSTSQSTTDGHHDSSIVVDGIISPASISTRTQAVGSEFWRVDLGRRFYIDRIVVYTASPDTGQLPSSRLLWTFHHCASNSLHVLSSSLPAAQCGNFKDWKQMRAMSWVSKTHMREIESNCVRAHAEICRPGDGPATGDSWKPTFLTRTKSLDCQILTSWPHLDLWTVRIPHAFEAFSGTPLADWKIY